MFDSRYPFGAFYLVALLRLLCVKLANSNFAASNMAHLSDRSGGARAEVLNGQQAPMKGELHVQPWIPFKSSLPARMSVSERFGTPRLPVSGDESCL